MGGWVAKAASWKRERMEGRYSYSSFPPRGNCGKEKSFTAGERRRRVDAEWLDVPSRPSCLALPITTTASLVKRSAYSSCAEAVSDIL